MVDQHLFNELHEQLLDERKRIEGEIQRLTSEGIRSDVFHTDENAAVDQHPADQGSELFEREKNMTVRATLEITLHEIDDALHKFDEGTYGLCTNCGKPIAEKRLSAMPMATHCIDCQAKLDRRAHAIAR
jgi:RNA polymerase-binding protein DksA